MINLITPPDILADGAPAIILVSVAAADTELTIAAARTLSKDINIYMCGDEVDASWFKSAADNSLKIFKRSKFAEIHEYLQAIDE